MIQIFQLTFKKATPMSRPQQVISFLRSWVIQKLKKKVLKNILTIYFSFEGQQTVIVFNKFNILISMISIIQ